MMLTVDRFEDGFALCESDDMLKRIPISLIDPDVCEGDAIFVGDDGLYHLDREETDKRRANIRKLLNDLWE